MKKVLIFSLAYYPHVGGAEVAIKEITDRISDIEFHMVTLNFEGEAREEKIGNVFVHRVGSGSSYLSKIFFVPRAAYAARSLHTTYRFDVFWAMMSYMLFPIVLLRFFGVRVPYLLTLQEGDTFAHMFSRWFILPLRPLLSIGFRNASAIQTISTYLAGWARQIGFAGPLFVVPNGVDTAHFSASYPESEINDIKDTLGKKMGDVFLITTSRLVRKNAADDVVRALPLLPQNVFFIILGIGPDEAMLKQLAGKLNVTTRVKFVGQIGHDTLPKYLKASDIFIRPSRSEGMGNSFVEAMAAGLPVIATQEGGIADFLFDEKRNPGVPITGWAVSKDAPHEIADVVKDVMARTEKTRAVIATARTMVSEKYDWNLIARDMREKVFKLLLTESE